MLHPLIKTPIADGIDVQPAYFENNEGFFIGVVFTHGAMKFTIQIAPEGYVFLKMLERVGELRGLRAIWRDLDWFADYCKARPKVGVTWLLGKVKQYKSGPHYASREKLRAFYTRVTNCVSLGWDGPLEWVGVDIRDHLPLPVLRRMRQDGESLPPIHHGTLEGWTHEVG